MHGDRHSVYPHVWLYATMRLDCEVLKQQNMPNDPDVDSIETEQEL